MLAGGVEELCIQTFLGFYKSGFLAGLKNNTVELSCPFDKRRNGIILGEGAAVLVLEDLESATSRGSHIYAEILGFGTAFEPYRINKYRLKGAGLNKAMRLALKKANISPEKISYVCSGANSTVEGDLLETLSIKDVFTAAAPKVCISSIKSMIGECFSASGVLQTAAAVCALTQQMIPPTINYQEKDDRCDLNYVTGKSRNFNIENVLINVFGPSGCNSSLVISKFSG